MDSTYISRISTNCQHHSFKHGFYRHQLGDVFDSMVQRCTNSNNKAYVNYGARGINICKKWMENRASFFKWAMLHGWEEHLSIDRKNNDNGYSPENCRFVTLGINNRNTQLIRSNNTSGYRGVVFAKHAGKWKSRINADGKCYHLGYFDSKVKAAKAYDKKAKELGDYPLNFG